MKLTGAESGLPAPKTSCLPAGRLLLLVTKEGSPQASQAEVYVWYKLMQTKLNFEKD